MVRAWWLLLCLALPAFAGEGMVVVLEAPLFRRPDASSPVIQYLRKGDKVYVHPAVLADPAKYIDAAPDAATDSRVRGELGLPPDDQLYRDGMAFILTKDKQGRDAWMLREHVHVWYEDHREAGQSDPSPDPTDYRLVEPLPASFPLDKRPRARAWLQAALATPWTRGYPYPKHVLNRGRGAQVEFSAAALWRRSEDPANRWFLGTTLTFRQASADYVFAGRRSREDWLRLGLGPVLSYDAYRGERQRLSLSLSALAYPFTMLEVRQQDLTGTAEPRSDHRGFWGFGAGLRAGALWQQQVAGDVEFIAGAWGEPESPAYMSSRREASHLSWWKGGKADNFVSGATFAMGIFAGIQSSY